MIRSTSAAAISAMEGTLTKGKRVYDHKMTDDDMRIWTEMLRVIDHQIKIIKANRKVENANSKNTSEGKV